MAPLAHEFVSGTGDKFWQFRHIPKALSQQQSAVAPLMIKAPSARLRYRRKAMPTADQWFYQIRAIGSRNQSPP